MKYACNKCSTIADEVTARNNWLKITTGAGSTYLLCENCSLGFWAAVSAHDHDQCINAPKICRHPDVCGSCEYKPETCIHHQKYLKDIAETNLRYTLPKLAEYEKVLDAKQGQTITTTTTQTEKQCLKLGECAYQVRTLNKCTATPSCTYQVCTNATNQT